MPKRILILAGAALPMAALTVWMTLVRQGGLSIREFFLGPLLVGGGMIGWLLVLHRVAAADRLEALGIVRPLRLGDAVAGLAGAAVFLLLQVVERPLLEMLFAPRRPSQELITLLRELAGSDLLLFLWLGPVVWVGVAGFEELWRAFMLRHLWNLSGRTLWTWTVVLLVSALIGLAHAYQGPAGVVSIGVQSFLMGWFFLVRGRIWPLIIAHGAYDSFQVILMVVSMRQTSSG